MIAKLGRRRRHLELLERAMFFDGGMGQPERRYPMGVINLHLRRPCGVPTVSHGRGESGPFVGWVLSRAVAPLGPSRVAPGARCAALAARAFALRRLTGARSADIDEALREAAELAGATLGPEDDLAVRLAGAIK